MQGPCYAHVHGGPHESQRQQRPVCLTNLIESITNESQDDRSDALQYFCARPEALVHLTILLQLGINLRL